MAKTAKAKGIKEHEELHAHVDEEGSGTVWVRAVEVDEEGEATRGVQVPLTPTTVAVFAVQLQDLADYAAKPK